MLLAQHPSSGVSLKYSTRHDCKLEQMAKSSLGWKSNLASASSLLLELIPNGSLSTILLFFIRFQNPTIISKKIGANHLMMQLEDDHYHLDVKWHGDSTHQVQEGPTRRYTVSIIATYSP